MKTGFIQDAVTGKLSQEWSKGQIFDAQFMQSRLNNQVPGFNSGDFANNPSYSDCSFNTAGPCGAPGPQQAQSYVNQMGTYSLFSQNQIPIFGKAYCKYRSPITADKIYKARLYTALHIAPSLKQSKIFTLGKMILR